MKKLFFVLLFVMATNAYAVDTNSAEFKAAVDMYRFWYPTVSMEGIMNGMRELGIQDNKKMFSAQADANLLGFTANQDTPYGAATLDLGEGPYVVEMPAGPFMGLVNDHSQRWIIDMGLPGQDAGKGGKYLIVPPDYKGQVPSGYYVGKSESNKVLVVARIIPMNESLDAAEANLKNIKIYPLSSAKSPKLIPVISVSGKKGDMTALRWEDNILYWEKLSKVINIEPVNRKYQQMYSSLRALGIEKGKAFRPTVQMKELLQQAAVEGKRQMLNTAFNSDRQDRIKWKDRKWEWLVLTSNPQWAIDHDMDLMARDRYFSQAIVMSPAMLKRDPTAGSLYWGAFRDSTKNTLDGSKTYKLNVPLPVPARLFWSVTLYDADTRSLINNGTKKSSLRSLIELANLGSAKSVDL